MHKIKTRGIIVLDGKIFLIREAKKHFYFLPGGTLEDGEDVRTCLKREFIEEFGIEPIVGDIINVREFINNEGELYLDFWFEIKNSEDFVSIDKSRTSHGFEFYDEGFYCLEEMKDLDVRPNDIQEILNLGNKVILL